MTTGFFQVVRMPDNIPWDDLDEGDKLHMVLEPRNPDNPKSLAVFLAVTKLGYLPRLIGSAVLETLKNHPKTKYEIKLVSFNQEMRSIKIALKLVEV